jgi:hypothetical protein
MKTTEHFKSTLRNAPLQGRFFGDAEDFEKSAWHFRALESERVVVPA